MPTMSKRPISASRLAAAVSAMPWSWAAGMKCVPTRPFVVAPQIAKPPASSQNALVRLACRSAESARRAAPDVATGGGSTASGGAP